MTLFGKLFGRSKGSALQQPEPARARTDTAGRASGNPASPSPAAPVTDEQREHFSYLTAGIKKFGLGTLGSVSLRNLITSPLPDPEAQLIRVVSHPDFEQSLNEIFDRNEQGENRNEVMQAFMQAVKEFGREGFITPALQSVMQNRTGTAREHVDRIFEHPDFVLALQKYDAARGDAARREADAGFLAYINGVEQEAFGNSNNLLKFTDHRPRKWEGMGYRHVVHYSRIAGTMSEREKFVYLMAHVFQHALAAQRDTDTVYNEYAMHITSALYGDGKGEQQWAVEADYLGDREDMLLKAAKERFDPWSVDQLFNSSAKTLLDLHDGDPNNAIARWGMARLRPHSVGWATER